MTPHPGNIEHFGEYTEDEEAVKEIAEILNKAEEAKVNSNAMKEEKKAPSDEEKSERPRGYRVLIEDLDSGEVTVYNEATCVIGTIVSVGEGTNEDRKVPLVFSKIGKTRCESILIMNAINECENLLQELRRRIIEKHCPGLAGEIENFFDEMLEKYHGGDEE